MISKKIVACEHTLSYNSGAYSRAISLISLSKYDEAVASLNLAFEHAELADDKKSMARCLEQLSIVFEKKGDFTRAALFLNAAFSCVPQSHVKPSPSYKAIDQFESRMLSALSDSTTTGVLRQPTPFASKNRAALASIRNKFSGILVSEASPNVPVLIQHITEHNEHLFLNIIAQSIDVLGKPPCAYCIVGVGTLGCKEMPTHSDIDYFIIIHRENEQNLSYFRKLAKAIEIKVINLGETPFKVLDKGKKSITPDGFCLDQWGHTPSGEDSIELIGTPEKLAQFQTDVWFERDQVTSNMLNTCRLLLGSNKLFKAYIVEKNKILRKKQGKQTVRQIRAIRVMQACLKEYRPKPRLEKDSYLYYGFKEELYRFPSSILSCLAMFYDLKSINSFDRIQELEKKGVFSSLTAKKLDVALRQALELRIRSQLSYGMMHSNNHKEIGVLHKAPETGQAFKDPFDFANATFFDISGTSSQAEMRAQAEAIFSRPGISGFRTISIPNFSASSDNFLYTVTQRDQSLVEDCRSVLAPLRYMALLFCDSKGKNNQFSNNDIFEIDHYSIANSLFESKKYQECIEFFTIHLDIYSRDVVSFIRLGRAYYELDNLEKAERYILKGLNEKNAITWKDSESADLMDSYYVLLARISQKKGDESKKIDYLNRAKTTLNLLMQKPAKDTQAMAGYLNGIIEFLKETEQWQEIIDIENSFSSYVFRVLLIDEQALFSPDHLSIFKAAIHQLLANFGSSASQQIIRHRLEELKRKYEQTEHYSSINRSHLIFLLANLALATNKPKLAFQHFQKAVAIVTDPFTKSGIVEIHLAKWYERVESSFLQGFLSYQMGLIKCREGTPGYVFVGILHYDIAVYYARLGDEAKKMEALMRALKHGKLPFKLKMDILPELGLYHLQKGNVEKGIELLITAFELSCNDNMGVLQSYTFKIAEHVINHFKLHPEHKGRLTPTRLVQYEQQVIPFFKHMQSAQQKTRDALTRRKHEHLESIKKIKHSLEKNSILFSVFRRHFSHNEYAYTPINKWSLFKTHSHAKPIKTFVINGSVSVMASAGDLIRLWSTSINEGLKVIKHASTDFYGFLGDCFLYTTKKNPNHVQVLSIQALARRAADDHREPISLEGYRPVGIGKTSILFAGEQNTMAFYCWNTESFVHIRPNMEPIQWFGITGHYIVLANAKTVLAIHTEKKSSVILFNHESDDIRQFLSSKEGFLAFTKSNMLICWDKDTLERQTIEHQLQPLDWQFKSGRCIVLDQAGTISIWARNLKTGKVEREGPALDSIPLSNCMATFEHFLFFASNSQTISVYDMLEKKVIRSINMNTPISGLEFSFSSQGEPTLFVSSGRDVHKLNFGIS